MKLLISNILLLFCFFSINAQEALTPFFKNPSINTNTNQKYLKEKSNKRTTALSLPFIEDFYQDDIYPDATKWQDNFAYINQTFPIAPISIGVATFDGLNPAGQAYSLITTTVGDADKLTSQAIDLSGLTATDKVLMSFFYAYKTLGEEPDINIDYLRLEFLDERDNWQRVWQKTTVLNDSSDIFKQVFIKIDTPFLHSNFQFRYINHGNLAGLNDVWAVDYIRLDKNRDSIFDSNINDMAFQYPSPSLLKRYYAMPFSHFDSTHVKDSVTLNIKNNFINPTTDIADKYVAEIINNNNNIANYFGPSRDYLPLTTNIEKYPLFPIPTTYSDDTVILEVNYSYEVSAEDLSNTTIIKNNSLKHKQIFSNYFAYDDGTPERGYWVTGSDDYRLAVGYNLSHADTLRAIKMQFTPIKSDINAALFSVVVWKKIQLGTNTEEIIYKHDNLTMADLVKEYGYDTINGFLYYNIREDFITDNNYDFPLVLEDSFYVGLIVYNKNTLTVGFDMNNNKKEYNYYMHTKVGSATAFKWFQSDFSGTMIINPILGKALEGYITSINNHKKYNIKIYPNPAKKYIHLSGITNESQIDIFDLNGSIIQSFRTTQDRIINIENLLPAMYVIHARNIVTNESGSLKFIKTNE